jgi:hypothetical protein
MSITRAAENNTKAVSAAFMEASLPEEKMKT